MINDYNRSDPFLIMVRDCEDVLTASIIKTLQMLIFQIISGIIIGIISLILHQPIISGFVFISIILCIYTFVYFVQKGNTKEVREIVFGDEYQALDLNRERMLQIGLRLKYVEGVFYLLKLIIRFLYFIYGTIGIVYLIKLIIYLITGGT